MFCFLSDALRASSWWDLVCEVLACVTLDSGRKPLCGFRLVWSAAWPSCESSSLMTMHNIPHDHAQHPCDHTQCPTCSQGALPGLALSLLVPGARAQRGFTGSKESAHISHTHSWPGPPLAEDEGQRVEVGGCWPGCESWQGRRGEEPWVCSWGATCQSSRVTCTLLTWDFLLY